MRESVFCSGQARYYARGRRIGLQFVAPCRIHRVLDQIVVDAGVNEVQQVENMTLWKRYCSTCTVAAIRLISLRRPAVACLPLRLARALGRFLPRHGPDQARRDVRLIKCGTMYCFACAQLNRLYESM